MKLIAKNGWIASEEKFGKNWFYLRPDGTIRIRLRGEKDWFKDKQEAQQFLDNWLPQKEWITTKQVKDAAEQSELCALDCSINHWKQIVLDVKEGQNHLGHFNCAICIRDSKEKGSPYNPQCTHCVLNNYLSRNINIICCVEYNNFMKNPTTKNAIKMLNKLVKIRNKKCDVLYYTRLGTKYNIGIDLAITNGLDKIQNWETKMIKEMTVAEVSEALGYDVKIVKESEKSKSLPYQFKAGDVAVGNCHTRRIIINVNEELQSFDVKGQWWNTGQEKFKNNNYKKIGVISDYINE